MNFIERWYKQRAEGRRTRPPQDEQDYSCEITEPVEGGLRTTTFFPQRMFLPYEKQIRERVKLEMEKFSQPHRIEHL